MSVRSAVLRIGLLTASALLFNSGFALWSGGQAVANPLSLGLSFAVWLCGAFTTALALLPSVPRWAQWLILLSVMVLACQSAYVAAQNYSPLTAMHPDNEMIGKYALEALKDGQNPYTWNFSDITRVYHDQGFLLTPLLDGSYQNRFTYPALPVLLLWAFDRVGLGQATIVNFVFFMLLMILIFVGARQKLRPLILLPLLILTTFANTAISGSQDVVWCTLLVGMIVAWKRPVLRAVLFGLAAAFHQQPWFAAPFLVILLWREGGTRSERLRRVMLFVGISAGLFLLINLPFILTDFLAWTMGALEPAYAAFNMYSQGLGGLSVYGLASFPREFYTALQFAFLAVALFIYVRHTRMVGQTFWIFPAIFFWLFYRGLANYWLFWIPPLLVALARSVSIPQTELPLYRWRVTANVGVAVLAVLVLLAIYYGSARPLIIASINDPIFTSPDGTTSGQLRLTVTNDDVRVFRPRFAVQHDGGEQALPWSIISGPESLNPNTSAVYLIGNDDSAFAVGQGAQVVISDADGSYDRRALVSVPADSSAVSADLIQNPAFIYWNNDGTLPTNWQLSSVGTDIVTARLQDLDAHEALALTAQSTSGTPDPFLLRLSQQVTYPGDLAMWVRPSIEISPSSGEVYGLEVDDGFHRLWILFGSKEEQTVSGPANHATIYLPAPLNAWSRQTIDLTQRYQQLGWTLRGQQVKLSLIASNNQQLESTWLFGPIEQDRDAISLDHRIAEAIAHPDTYYVDAGDQYRTQRDYDQAIQAYSTALTYNPASADAYFGIAQCKWNMGDLRGTATAFGKALSLWAASFAS